MVYKHYAFELMPYGATCKVQCTNNNKYTKAIVNYSTSTSYTVETKPLGLNYAEFIESSIEPVEMTFNYYKKNGILVEIITNLEIKTNNNIRKDSTGHYSIINSNWLSSGNGIFTVSNETWFNGPRTETPYIYLCFNKVKIENCFLDHSVDWVTNGFRSLTYDNIKLYPHYNSNLKATLARYITISWNQVENNQLLYGEDDGMNEFHNRYYIYSFKNGVQEKLYSSDKHSEVIQGFTYNILRMDGGSNVKKYIGPYYIGFVVNIGEVGEWIPGSQYYIKSGTYYGYDSEGYKQDTIVNAKTASINVDNSIPILYSIDYYGNLKNSFYYTNVESYSTKPYFSPANGIELESDWNLTCTSFNECPSYCDDCPSNCPAQGGDSSQTYTVLVVNGPAGTGYGVTGWKIGTSEQVWIANNDYTNYSVYGESTYKIGTDIGVAKSEYVYEETRTKQDCGGCTCHEESPCPCEMQSQIYYCTNCTCYCYGNNLFCTQNAVYCNSDEQIC